MTDAEMVTAEYAAFMKGPDYYVTFRATAPILGWPFRGPWQQATHGIGTEGEALDLSKVNLPGGDFEGAKFIGMSSIKLDGVDFS